MQRLGDYIVPAKSTARTRELIRCDDVRVSSDLVPSLRYNE